MRWYEKVMTIRAILLIAGRIGVTEKSHEVSVYSQLVYSAPVIIQEFY